MSTVLVNLVYLDPPRNGGVSRIAHEVALLLCAMEGVEVVFAIGAGFASEFPAWLGLPARVIPCLTDQPPGPLLKALKPDFIISPLFGIEPFEGQDFKTALHVTGIPDALALDKPELFLPHERQVRTLSYERARGAKVIVTLSEYAKQRLQERLNLPAAQIQVVGLGADFASEPSGEHQIPAAVTRPYVFYPANNWPHKRHDLLFKMMAEVWKISPELHLVLTGGRSGGVDLQALAAGAPPTKVHDLGFVDEAQLKTLYQNAEAMIFPSEHEGFGMPIVEAMLNGCPVICAPLTSIPEVAGDAALYVRSDNPHDWAKAFLNELPQRRTEWIEAGKQQAAQFTWSKMRDGWAKALQAAGLRSGTGINMLIVPLDAVLAEIGRWREEGGGMGAKQGSARLERLLQQVEAVRLSENQNRFSNMRGIGFIVRSLIRIRNLGHMWEARAHLDQAMVDHLAALEAEPKADKN